MRRSARGPAGALVLSMLIAGVLAPPALARKTIYSGQLLGPAALQPGSIIGFKLVSAGKGRKAHPVSALKLNAFWYTVFPNGGGAAVPGTNPLCRDSLGNRAQPYVISYASLQMSIPVTQRAFSVTQTYPAPYGYTGSETYEIQGRIPRKGPATGTFRYTGSWTSPVQGQVTCDDTAAWKASPSSQAVTLE